MNSRVLKSIKESLRLSKINEESLYFTIKGVRYMKTGSTINSNNSCTIRVKNLDMPYGFNRFKEIGETTLKELLK